MNEALLKPKRKAYVLVIGCAQVYVRPYLTPILL